MIKRLREKVRRRYRSSVTGRFVTKMWALFNPRESVAEKIDD